MVNFTLIYLSSINIKRKRGCMMKILLLSHGNFAKECYLTCQMIMGSIESVSYITFSYGQDLELYQCQIEEQLASNDQTLILCNLFGGSPFMIASKLLAKPDISERVELVTGLNMAMLLEVCSNLDENLAKLKEIAIKAGKNGIVDLKEKLNS